MGARQSKRSVDITTTPKKEGIPAEGGVVGDAAAPGDGKLERIEEADTKPTTNGIAPHTDSAEDKENDKDETTEKDKEQQPQEEIKVEETKQESSGDSPAEVAEVTTPTEATPASPNAATSPDSKETKKKDKKKKWSFRSISFSKKDKTKPSRDEAPKNGDVTKEEPLAEGGEDAENATASASSPVEEKSAASSPSADEQVVAPTVAAVAEPKKEAAAASPAAAAAAAAVASPVEEKKKEPTPSAPTPVPSVEDKKEEAIEKVEVEKKVVEVSQSAGGHFVVDPVEIPVYRVQPVATPSIIERKAREDLLSMPPSSPPPTPIDPSPLQQARQAAANAIALAEALKLPAVAADEEESTPAPPPLDIACPSSREEIFPQESRAGESITTANASLQSLDSSTDLPPTEAIFVLAEVECLPVIEADIEVKRSQDVAKKVGETLRNDRDNKEAELKIEDNVAMKEKVFKCQKSEAHTVNKTSPLAMECDSKNTLSKDAEEIPDVAAMAKVVNEALPAVEIKNEINSREVAMKINVQSNAGHNEKEAETLSSAEIEIRGACPAVKQYLSSENMKSFPDETQHVELIKKLSDLDLPSSVERCIDVRKSSEVNSASFARLIESPSKGLEQSSEVVEQSSEIPIEYEHDVKYVPKEIEEEEETASVELYINSEEGPLSVSEDILVEAKPALIIPEDDSVEELTDTTESVKVIPDEEKLEIEFDSDLLMEETLTSDELENMSVPRNTTEPLSEFVSVSDSHMKNEIKAANEIENTLPCPLEDLTLKFSSQIISELQDMSAIETESIVNKKEPTAIFTSAAIESGMFTTRPSGIEQTEEIKKSSLSSKDHVTSPKFYPSDDLESMHRLPLLLSDAPTCSLSERHSSEPQTLVLSPEPESVPISLEDLPPAPEDTGTQSLDSFDYPLPPDELSCPLSIDPPNMSVAELPPAPVEHPVSPRDPTETPLTPPISPNFQQSNITFGIATETAMKGRSQIPSCYEDSSNRERSMLLSEPLTMSYDQSDVESKERLMAECVAKTESQEEALSCQLSNSIPSTATKEHHQNAPEVEAPIENNVAHDINTTESDEAPKFAPPAIPTEAPASPPTAPAITEDVASVTKAIEEIDISDKAVAAAVNEAIECNTNEIIADAHHQNNINE